MEGEYSMEQPSLVSSSNEDGVLDKVTFSNPQQAVMEEAYCTGSLLLPSTSRVGGKYLRGQPPVTLGK